MSRFLSLTQNAACLNIDGSISSQATVKQIDSQVSGIALPCIHTR